MMNYLEELLYMSGLDMMAAISNKEHLARLPPKPGIQLKKDGRSHLPGSSKHNLDPKTHYKTPVFHNSQCCIDQK